MLKIAMNWKWREKKNNRQNVKFTENYLNINAFVRLARLIVVWCRISREKNKHRKARKKKRWILFFLWSFQWTWLEKDDGVWFDYFQQRTKYEKLFGPSNEKLYIKIKDYFSHKNIHDFHFTENICADSLTRENICADSFSPEEKSIEYSWIKYVWNVILTQATFNQMCNSVSKTPLKHTT